MDKKLKQDNVNVVGEKYVRNDDGKLTLTVDDKLKKPGNLIIKNF